MRRLHFIVEGQTELSFVNKQLKRHLESMSSSCSISASIIKSTRGGISKYSDLKKDVETLIYQSDIIVTTMIDYYGLPKDFPQFVKAQQEPDIKKKVHLLQDAIKADFVCNQRTELIPYIQLHEFEALLFSDIESISQSFSGHGYSSVLSELQKCREDFESPEDINNSKETAPSKRLIQIVKGYNKVLDSERIIKKIGLNKIRTECPRFDAWLSLLETKIQS